MQATSGGSRLSRRGPDSWLSCKSMDLIIMPYERCVHIVDDEATVRDSLAVLLSTAGIMSRAYASAEEYLATVPLSEPACVILDNQLPGLSGMELLKCIADAASNTAVIMITEYGDVPPAFSAMKAGAFHFVQKPFDAEALLIIVEETLARAEPRQCLRWSTSAEKSIRRR